MKPVLVSVQSIQRDPEGQELKIELVSEGKYYIKDGTQYIVYEESELTEMKGVTTVIKVLSYPEGPSYCCVWGNFASGRNFIRER